MKGTYNKVLPVGLFFVFALFLIPLISNSAPLVPPRITHPDKEDTDHNLIYDTLENTIEKMVMEQKGDELVRIEVVLYTPYTEDDLEMFRSLGGNVIHTFEAVSYGFSGTIPVQQIRTLAVELNVKERLCVIADDPKGSGHLDYSARHTRTRNSDVWGAGYNGNSNTTIAILDTGIDDSHTDFSGRVSSGWTDTTYHGYSNKLDYHGHGTHVAGIALGSGGSYGTGSSGMYVVVNHAGYLPSAGTGYFDFVEVKNTGSNALSVHLYWNGSGTTQVSSRNPSWSWMSYQNSSSSPNSLYYSSITTTGVYKPFFGNSSGASGAYCGLTVHSYNPVGDGYNLFCGMAPGCTLLGVKVLKDDSSGNSTDWGEGLDWCVTNRDTYNIRVINMSMGLFNGDTNSTLDSKVNIAVANGIVVVCSAGNDYPTNTIPSPGNAAKAITVGAINDEGAMTNYSSNGFSGQNKPDVVAPGGSRVAGTLVTSVETNDGDAYNNQSDHTSNNYMNMWGTSMAAPMVSGLAALLIDGQEQGGDSWNSTQAEVLRIKNIILMTATETNKNGEYKWNGGNTPNTASGNNPSLNRGGRDLVEGFGKINADAASDAMTRSLAINSSSIQYTLGAGVLDRKAMAVNLNLSSGTAYDLKLVADSGSLDCDLYLYSGTPDSNGNPVIVTSQTNASTGTNEQIIDYTPSSSGTYYLVGKYVTGSGSGIYHFEVGEHTLVKDWLLF